MGNSYSYVSHLHVEHCSGTKIAPTAETSSYLILFVPWIAILINIINLNYQEMHTDYTKLKVCVWTLECVSVINRHTHDDANKKEYKINT